MALVFLLPSLSETNMINAGVFLVFCKLQVALCLKVVSHPSHLKVQGLS